MKQNSQRRLRDFFRENPAATNEEAAGTLQYTLSTIQTRLYQMKNSGQITIESIDGKRFITVNWDEVDGSTFKRDTLMEMAQQLIDANQADITADQLRENCKLLIHIIDRL